jgi:hypothetical protein
MVYAVDVDADFLAGVDKTALTDVNPGMVAVYGKPDDDQGRYGNFSFTPVPKGFLLVDLAADPAGIFTGYLVVRQFDSISPEDFGRQSPTVEAHSLITPAVDKWYTDQVIQSDTHCSYSPPSGMLGSPPYRTELPRSRQDCSVPSQAGSDPA